MWKNYHFAHPYLLSSHALLSYTEKKLLLASACTRVISICYLITRIYDGMRGGILTGPIWGQLRRTEFLSICGVFFLSFFFFSEEWTCSSQALVHEAWHGFIVVEVTETSWCDFWESQTFITFNERETFNGVGSQSCLWSAMGRCIYTRSVSAFAFSDGHLWKVLPFKQRECRFGKLLLSG